MCEETTTLFYYRIIYFYTFKVELKIKLFNEYHLTPIYVLTIIRLYMIDIHI